MSIAKKTILRPDGKLSDRVVQTETVQLVNAATASGSAFQVPKDSDFVAFMNTAALNTVGAVTVDLQGSFDGSTWVDVDASFMTDLDTAVKVKVYNASASGDFPFYRLQFDCAGAETGVLTYKITQ